VAALKTIGAIGPVEHSIPYSTLIDAGVLARPVVRMVPFKHSGKGAEGSWTDVYRTKLVRNKSRNALLANMAAMAAKPCLLFFEQIEHATWLDCHLQAHGLRTAVAHGDHDASERKRMLRELADGEIDVLVASVIFNKGIDVPTLRSVVIGGGKSSTVACLQRVGRGMRRAPDKDTFEVWDVLDLDHPWLERHAEERRSALNARGIPVEVVRA
jgi:superfamily II DNA or RNA helicase